MSKTATALIFKFFMTLILAAAVFMLLNNNSWFWILAVAIAATVLNYLVGDLYVLPKFGNIVAAAGDGIMAALVAYVTDLFTPLFQTTFASLAIFALLVGVGEYFFHQYLRRADEVAPQE